MVEIPRSLWLNSNSEAYLKYCYRKILEMEDALEDADFEFKKITSFFLLLRTNNDDSEILRYCHSAERMVPDRLQEKIPKKYEEFLQQTSYLSKYPFSLESAIENHRLLKRVLARLRRLSLTEKSFLKEAILYEDVISAVQEQRRL